MLILIDINIWDMVLALIGKGEFSFGNEFGRNVIIFGLDVSSCRKIDNSKKDCNYWQRSYTRIITYSYCRKRVLN